MFHYQLQCGCGFRSNVVGFGTDAWERGFHVPVLIPGDEVLHELKLEKFDSELENLSDEMLDNAIADGVAESYGVNAIAISPGAACDPVELFECPRCKENAAKFRFAGF